MTSLPPLIRTYLLNRGIANEVIDSNGLGWSSDNKLVIPVYDEHYKFLFNKYRRSPLLDTGPKYTYQKGATTQLYHSAALHSANPLLIICEGELDVLLLETMGYPAVTSTGGALSFKPEWASRFNSKFVYIIMDTDEAGIAGACLIQAAIPHAMLVSLPLKPGEGKDVTDFFAHHSIMEFTNALNKGINFRVPQDLDWLVDSPFTKQQAKEKLNEFSLLLDELTKTKRDLDNRGESSPFIPHLIEHANERIDRYKSFIANRRPLVREGEDRKEAAKRVPITNYLQFNPTGFAKCQWHEDSSPSLKYYKKDNHAFCFSCRKYVDVIDVVMQIKNLSFKEAIKELVP